MTQWWQALVGGRFYIRVIVPTIVFDHYGHLGMCHTLCLLYYYTPLRKCPSSNAYIVTRMIHQLKAEAQSYHKPKVGKRWCMLVQLTSFSSAFNPVLHQLHQLSGSILCWCSAPTKCKLVHIGAQLTTQTWQKMIQKWKETDSSQMGAVPFCLPMTPY